MARIETALTRLLGIEHPILTAPVTGAVGGALANAVAQAGAFGIIALGHDEAVIRREIAAAGDARIGIGFITWQLFATQLRSMSRWRRRLRRSCFRSATLHATFRASGQLASG